MKTMEMQEMRAVVGGRWKCKQCGHKEWVYINAIEHCNCEAHYNGSTNFTDWVKWCW